MAMQASAYTSIDISLEEDLLRRDLTINAMAEDQHRNIIDPYGGQEDLETVSFATIACFSGRSSENLRCPVRSETCTTWLSGCGSNAGINEQHGE